MSKLCVPLAAITVAAFVLLPWTSVAQDKDEKREKVRIITVDGVELYAHFYPCLDAKIKNPPAIIMLHPLGTGENSSKKAWVALASALQTNAAVLTFDFRGHGQSTEVEAGAFWKVQANVNQIKGGFKAKTDNKTTIEFKDFEKSYYNVLVNDIYACKSYLDRRHDTRGDCNTCSTVMLGAESGAVLGAIWLNAEFHRHRLIPNPMGIGLGALDPKAEGNDVITCVWLSANSVLGPRDQAAPRTIALGSTLSIALKEKATPTVFFYGDGDTKAKAAATKALDLLPKKDKKTIYAWTDKVEIKNTDLRGIDLLQKSLGVDRAIHKYLFGTKEDPDDGVIKSKFRDYTEREFRKTQYQWRQPGTNPNLGIGIPAKTVAYPNDFVWNDFGKYVKY